MALPVHGLFRKAQTYLDSRKKLHIVRPGDDTEGSGISAEDRQKITSEIDEILARKRSKVTPEILSFTPRKRGSLLPLVVNLGAVVVVAAGILLALYLSRRDEQTILAAPVALQTAEGKLLEAMKQESQQQLQSKDREIAGIRERLAGVDKETERIRLEADARVQERQKAMEDALAKSLAEERRRLEATGLSQEAVDRRITDMEARNRGQMDEQLASFRAQADAERAEREKTIQQMKAGYEQTLAQAQTERSTLQQENERKQAELEAGYRQKQTALEKDKAQAQGELERLRAEREKEQMVLTQTLSFYRRARDELQAERPQGARRVLAELREFLDQPSVAALPAMSQRRSVELFLVGSLEELIRRQTSERGSAESMQSLVASAELVTAVAGLVQQGDALFEQQDYAGARELYLSAMARIPAVRVGYARLAEIEKTFADTRKSQVAALLSFGNSAYKRGDYAGAEAQYGKALEVLQGERGTVDTLIAQLEEIGALTKNRDSAARLADSTARLAALEEEERKRADTLAQINALRDRFGQLAGQSSASPRDNLLALLETKLLVQKILLSRDVIAQYPDLSDRLDRYLDALVAERASEARLQTIRDLDTLLGSLIEKSGKERAERVLLSYNSQDQKGTLLRILDKLQVLLR